MDCEWRRSQFKTSRPFTSFQDKSRQRAVTSHVEIQPRRRQRPGGGILGARLGQACCGSQTVDRRRLLGGIWLVPSTEPGPTPSLAFQQAKALFARATAAKLGKAKGYKSWFALEHQVMPRPQTASDATKRGSSPHVPNTTFSPRSPKHHPGGVQAHNFHCNR